MEPRLNPTGTNSRPTYPNRTNHNPNSGIVDLRHSGPVPTDLVS